MKLMEWVGVFHKFRSIGPNFTGGGGGLPLIKFKFEKNQNITGSRSAETKENFQESSNNNKNMDGGHLCGK